MIQLGRKCPDCGADISGRGASAKRCGPCVKKKAGADALRRYYAKRGPKTCLVCGTNINHRKGPARFCEECVGEPDRNGRIPPLALASNKRQSCPYPGCERYGRMYGVFHPAFRRWMPMCWTDADRLLNGPACPPKPLAKAEGKGAR